MTLTQKKELKKTKPKKQSDWLSTGTVTYLGLLEGTRKEDPLVLLVVENLACHRDLHKNTKKNKTKGNSHHEHTHTQ